MFEPGEGTPPIGGLYPFLPASDWVQVTWPMTFDTKEAILEAIATAGRDKRAVLGHIAEHAPTTALLASVREGSKHASTLLLPGLTGKRSSAQLARVLKKMIQSNDGDIRGVAFHALMSHASAATIRFVAADLKAALTTEQESRNRELLMALTRTTS